MGLWAHGPHGPMGPWAPWAHGPMAPHSLLSPEGWPYWYDIIKHNIILHRTVFFLAWEFQGRLFQAIQRSTAGTPTVQRRRPALAEIILYYIILRYITLYLMISHGIALYDFIAHYMTLHHIILHYITLYYILSHYITLYYII